MAEWSSWWLQLHWGSQVHCSIHFHWHLPNENGWFSRNKYSPSQVLNLWPTGHEATMPTTQAPARSSQAKIIRTKVRASPSSLSYLSEKNWSQLLKLKLDQKKSFKLLRNLENQISTFFAAAVVEWRFWVKFDQNGSKNGSKLDSRGTKSMIQITIRFHPM